MGNSVDEPSPSSCEEGFAEVERQKREGYEEVCYLQQVFGKGEC